MKRALIASFAALGIIAAPAVAATSVTKTDAKVTKTEKKAAKVQKKAAKTAARQEAAKAPAKGK
jgi:hypothetical protein